MSKKLKARELMWMILPVVLLGGAAWWFNQQAQLRVGPPRLLPLQWERVPIDAADVARGYEFAVKTRVHMVGEVERPKGFARFMPNYNIDRRTFHLQYRDAQGWQEARLPRKGLPLTFLLGHDEDLIIQFRLASVPHDAQEVRARGLFSVEEAFQSPSSWKPPSRYFKSYSRGRGRYRVWLVSAQQPFDISIKGPDELFPALHVSRAPAIKVANAKWIVDVSKDSDWLQNVIVLQLRRTDGGSWDNPPKFASQNLHLFDGNGREIILLDPFTKKKHELDFWLNSSVTFQPDSPTNDLFAVLATGQFSPANGWLNIKAPLRLRGEISDGQSWPQKIDVPIPRVSMKTEDFGAAK